MPRVLNVGDDTSGSVMIGEGEPLVFIGGPCAIESESHAMMMAEKLKEICERLKMPLIFKTCYD